MSSRAILMSLAALFVVAGMVLGLRTISADGSECGSVFSPSSTESTMKDQITEGISGDDAGAGEACDSAIGDAKPFTYGAIGLGVLALFASLTVSSDRPRTA